MMEYVNVVTVMDMTALKFEEDELDGNSVQKDEVSATAEGMTWSDRCERSRLNFSSPKAGGTKVLKMLGRKASPDIWSTVQKTICKC